MPRRTSLLNSARSRAIQNPAAHGGELGVRHQLLPRLSPPPAGARCGLVCAPVNKTCPILACFVQCNGYAIDRTAVCRVRVKGKNKSAAFYTETCKMRHFWSECRDSNSRPLEPHSSAIPNFATPGYSVVPQTAHLEYHSFRRFASPILNFFQISSEAFC